MYYVITKFLSITFSYSANPVCFLMREWSWKPHKTSSCKESQVNDLNCIFHNELTKIITNLKFNLNFIHIF